ncbi:MAG: SRPBCC family protein [Deltaproteobacteria bacterium]|nr:SRPBCC family protein [Deltaproteobacteria bacterium]
MAHVVTDLDSTASPERVIHALTDFSSRRLELWPNIDPTTYKLESTEPTSAEVTEGSASFGGVWERSHYDWSRSGTVRIDVQDSNTFEPGSYWLYEVTPLPNGGSHVHMEFDRRPRNFKGQMLSALLTVAGKPVFQKSLGETLKRIEASA